MYVVIAFVCRFDMSWICAQFSHVGWHKGAISIPPAKGCEVRVCVCVHMCVGVCVCTCSPQGS